MLKYAESLILVEFEDGEVVADASHHKRKIAMRNIRDKVIHLFCETMLAPHMLESSTAWEIRSQPLYAGSTMYGRNIGDAAILLLLFWRWVSAINLTVASPTAPYQHYWGTAGNRTDAVQHLDHRYILPSRVVDRRER